MGNIKIERDMSKALEKADIVVDQTFTGKDGEVLGGKKIFTRIQNALDSIDASTKQSTVIFIKKGKYHEKLEITKPGITLIGEERDETILTYNVANGSEKPDGSTYGTSGSASVTVREEDFSAINVTFENAFDYFKETAKSDDDPTKLKGVQAVAFRTTDNNQGAYLENCRFRSVQDTLLPDAGTQYFKDCIIEGAVDFIFGKGAAVFENCDIISLDRGSQSNNGYVTAASTLITQEYGFLFENCRLVKESDQMANQSVYLGRPWHPGGNPDAQGSVLFNNCELGPHIKEEGWTQMSGFSPMDARLYEYENNGPGAVTSETRKVLNKEEAERFSSELYKLCTK